MKKQTKRLEYYTAAGKRIFSVVLPKDVVDQLEQIARDEEIPRQSVILHACRDYIAKYPRIVQAKALVS